MEIGRTSERALLLEMSEDATYGISRHGRDSVVKGGEFWLSDSTEPIVVRHSGCSVVVLRIGEAALKASTRCVARPSRCP